VEIEAARIMENYQEQIKLFAWFVLCVHNIFAA